MTAFIEAQDLCVRRGARAALEVEALQIQRAEVLALVGPNGAGKSTLLLALAGLIPLEEGRIWFGERRMEDWDPLEYRRRISFVFQEPLLLDLTVAENVALGLAFRGIPKAEAKTRSNLWLQRLGIGSLAQRRAAELSGGEAQRVSLARALVLEPELLLLDEPFAALDPPSRAGLIDDLSALLERERRTTIVVTHDLKEATRLADRIGVVVGGRLRQVGTARQIKARPSDPEVAAFLRTL
jgi:tungstate transport system ATP-binding protein